MGKNIFLMVVLFIFTFVSLILINIFISTGEIWIHEMSLYYLMLFIVLPLILTLYLIAIFIKGVYKKELSKKYMYSYGIYLFLIAVFYFGFYSQNTHYQYILESEFETSLQNIDISSKENGLEKINELSQMSSGLINVLQETQTKQNKLHHCLTFESDCDNIDVPELLSDSQIFIQENIQEIEEINKHVEEINTFRYFKYDIASDNFPSISGYTTLARLSLFQAIYFLENGDESKAIKILSDYVILGEKLMTGDTTLIGMIVGITNYSVALENIGYIINTYDIDISSDNFSKILVLLNTEIPAENIFSNAIKMEYQMNMYGIEKNIHSSMLFDMDEFLNIMRNGWQKVINGESRMYEAYTPSIFKREYVYYTLFGRGFSSFAGYREDIERLNMKKIEILEQLSQ